MKRTILSAVAALVFVVAFVELGLWQLRRHDEKRAFNALLLSRSSSPAVDVATLFDEPLEGLAYRHSVATGTFDTEREIVIVNRSLDGTPGNHVVTPLVLGDGRAVLVDRGWVPQERRDPPVADALPPSGRMRVDGALFPSEVRRNFGQELPPTGVLETAVRIDVPRLSRQLPYRVFPYWLQLRAQDPAQSAALPKIVPLPTREAGPHLSYAIQWFLFATVTVVGVSAIEIRRRVRDRSRSSENDAGAVAGPRA